MNKKADDITVFNKNNLKKKQAVLCSVIKAAGTFVRSMNKNRRHGCVFNDKTGRHWVAICVAKKKAYLSCTGLLAPSAEAWRHLCVERRYCLQVPSFCLCFLLSSAPLRFSGPCQSVVGNVPASLRSSQLLSVLPTFCRNAAATARRGLSDW